MLSDSQVLVNTQSTDLITSIEQLRSVLPAVTDAMAATMAGIAQRYTFRLPRFYAEKILLNDIHDPLWALALPNQGELADAGEERWDAFQLADRAVNHPRWIQKYRYEALLRVTDFCSGLCRYCYLKNRDVTPGRISHQEIDAMFDQAEQSPQRRELREIILSGGDPLAVPAAVLEHIARRMDRLNKTVARRITVTIHTREPVWYPQRILGNTALHQALKQLSPASYILHVVHPREVTPELHQAMLSLTELADSRRPLMMSQHPLFRGINDNASIITEMYDRMDSGPVVFKPYYLIHPFPDGTLPQHRLTLLESQKILRDLASAPGTRVPLLTIPTPMGKCVIGPYEQLIDRGGYYLLHTKDSVPVHYAVSPHYNPSETRDHIPIMPEIHRAAVSSNAG